MPSYTVTCGHLLQVHLAIDPILLAGPSRATAGPGKTRSRGTITPPHSVCLEIETQKVSRGMKRGEVSPHHPTIGSRERRKLPRRSPG